MASLNLEITFEYKTIQGKLTDAQLNELGKQGWELKHLEVSRQHILTSIIVMYEYLFMRSKP